MSELLKVSSNPHIRSKVTTSSIMTAVVIALLPAAGFGIYNFGSMTMNSLVTCLGSMIICTVFSCLAGYGVTRFNFKGKKSFLATGAPGTSAVDSSAGGLSD